MFKKGGAVWDYVPKIFEEGQQLFYSIGEDICLVF